MTEDKTMTTKNCTECAQTYPATADYFGVRKGNADGLTGRCRPCQKEARRAATARRREALTPEERAAKHAQELERKRAYNEANSERLAKQREIAKVRANIRNELQLLRRLRDAIDAAGDVPNPWLPSDEWSRWARHMEAGLRERYAVPACPEPPEGVSEFTDPVAYTRWQREVYEPYRRADAAAREAMMADPVAQHIRSVRDTFDDRRIIYQYGSLRKAYDALVEKISGYSAELIHEGLSYEPDTREHRMDPALERWMKRYMRDWNRRDAERSPEEIAARETALGELLGGDLSVDAIASQNRQERENRRADREGRPLRNVAVLDLGDDADDMAALQRDRDWHREEAEKAEARRKARNRRRKERRKKAKELAAKEAERKAKRAEAARRRRAEERGA